MSTDALAALLKMADSDVANRPDAVSCIASKYWESLAIAAIARGVVVLPADHPLRTGQPSEAMVSAARREAATVEFRLPDWERMQCALRAALAVLRETI